MRSLVPSVPEIRTPLAPILFPAFEPSCSRGRFGDESIKPKLRTLTIEPAFVKIRNCRIRVETY
jgi:hypothetical protein